MVISDIRRVPQHRLTWQDDTSGNALKHASQSISWRDVTASTTNTLLNQQLQALETCQKNPNFLEIDNPINIFFGFDKYCS